MLIPTIKPRYYQLPFFYSMANGARHAVISWPRRSGKDVVCFSFMVMKAMQEVGTYYYCFPTLELGKEILWDNMTTIDGRSGYMIDLLIPPELVLKRNNQDHYVQLINGSIIRMKGTDSGKVFGNDGKGFIFSEWQSHKPEVYDFIRPIIRQNRGWSIFNGTMRGEDNHLYKDIMRNATVDGWFTQWLKPIDTLAYYWITPERYPEEYQISVNPALEGMIDPYSGELFDNIQAEVDGGASYHMTRQEFLNEAVTHVEGSVFALEISEMKICGRTDERYDPSKPVYTFWDLGGVRNDSDKTTIVFAQMDSCSSVARIIDYYENTGRLRGHYIDILKAKPYNYGGHYLPHDGKRSNAWSGEGMKETARELYDIEFRYIPKSASVMNDIEVMRRDFRNYGIALKECADCKVLFGHMSRYHMSKTTDKPCHRNNCVICRGASHGVDALRMMALGRHLGMVEPYIQPSSRRKLKTDWDDNYVIA